MIALSRPKWFPLSITLLGVGLMFALSAWQIQRLSWKEALIAKVEAAQKAEPLSELPATTDLPAHEFQRIALRGTYDYAHEFHLAARYYRGKVGYHILTPMQLESGDWVLVNRGWVDSSEKDRVATPAYQVSGPVSVVARIRVGDERNTFTPPSQPEKNLWFGRDVAAMAEHSGLALYPATFDALEQLPALTKPVLVSGEITLRNDHLGYAITWFLIGLGGIAVFVVYHRKR